MDLQPWMAQVGIASAAVALFLIVGKSYINYIGTQLKEERIAHEREIGRLKDSWEARLSDANKAVTSWETTAHRLQAASEEDRRQIAKLMTVNDTTEALLRAIREEARRK